MKTAIVRYSEHEQKLITDFVKSFEGKVIPVKDISDFCDTLNLSFHGGEEIRRLNAMSAKIYSDRAKLKAGFVPGERRPCIRSAKKDREPRHTVCNVLLPLPLGRLVACAKDIKKKVDEFCNAVVEFQAEFEQDRQMLKKLTKIRQAVEEFQIPKA